MENDPLWGVEVQGLGCHHEGRKKKHLLASSELARHKSCNILMDVIALRSSREGILLMEQFIRRLDDIEVPNTLYVSVLWTSCVWDASSNRQPKTT